MDQLKIHVLFIPPHTSNMLQPLDLITFALQKRWKKNIKVDKRFTYQSKQVIEAYESVFRASSPNYIVLAFKRAGIIRTRIVYDKNSQPFQAHRVAKTFASAYIEMMEKRYKKYAKQKYENECQELIEERRHQIPIHDLYKMF